jgi:polar amino acid transport system substrate-binding protein
MIMKSRMKSINLSASYLILMLLVVAAAVLPASAWGDSPFPKFRATKTEVKKSDDVQGMRLRLLSDENFAPFSFQGSDGLQKGIAVDLARAACKKLGVTCEIKFLPFDKLMPQLEQNEGDMIISGLRANAALLVKADMTRAYYVSSGRFAVKQGSALKDALSTTLSGRKLGYVKNSTHARFIEKYYPRADLKPFEDARQMLEALRSDAIDAAYGDTLQLAFWFKGSASANCCEALGKPYMDRETFSQSLVFVLPKDRQSLREAFDAALDQLEEDGVTAETFSRYVPAPLW